MEIVHITPPTYADSESYAGKRMGFSIDDKVVLRVYEYPRADDEHCVLRSVYNANAWASLVFTADEPTEVDRELVES